MKTLFIAVFVVVVFTGCTNLHASPNSMNGQSDSKSSHQVVSVSEVQWEQLNPARGDKSPQADTLWGDRNDKVPTGFLAKFVNGFASPPHIHNVTYRAVVISGRIHNDDPDAEHMWMRTGSFWTQPKGEVHITAAKCGTNIALVEIDQGPYLVRPPEDAFDSGERPVNIEQSNIVWVDPPGMTTSKIGPKLAYLWGNLQGNQSNGTFIKLPPGYSAKIYSSGSTLRAVLIKGRIQYMSDQARTLDPGSYFSSEGEWMHTISSHPGSESVIYVRSIGMYKLLY